MNFLGADLDFLGIMIMSLCVLSSLLIGIVTYIYIKYGMIMTFGTPKVLSI